MGTTCGLGNNRIDNLQVKQVLRREFHDLASLFRTRRVLPQNRGETFWRKHRIHRVLEHEHPVAHGKRQRAARPPFAADHANHGDFQGAHELDTASDCLALATLLCFQARIGSGCVNKCDDGTTKLLCRAHGSLRLSIPLWRWHAKVKGHTLLDRRALTMSHNRHRASVERGDGAHDCLVVGGCPVASLLEYVFEQRIHVLLDTRTLRHASKSYALRSGESRIIFESHAQHLQNRAA